MAQWANQKGASSFVDLSTLIMLPIFSSKDGQYRTPA
jgi:hypothetical protein